MSLKKISILLVSALSMTACNKFRAIDSGKDGRQARQYTQDKREQQKLELEQKSVNLVKSAEAAMSAGSLDAAVASVNDALNLNPANGKAKFYQELLSVPVSMRGFFKRVTPYTGNLGEENQKKYTAQMESLPSSDMKSFLTSAKEDVKTEADMSEYVKSIHAAFDNFRKYLTDNKDVLFPEHRNPDAPVKAEDEFVANENGTHGGGEVGVETMKVEDVVSCEHNVVSPSAFQIAECMLSEVVSLRMGQGSFESVMSQLDHAEEHLMTIVHALKQEF